MPPLSRVAAPLGVAEASSSGGYAVAVQSLDAFWDAVGTFGDAIGSISVVPLLIGLALHLASVGFKAIGWRAILRAAIPRGPVPARPVILAMYSGVALNGVLPARAGEVLRLFLVRQRVARTTYPMLAASLMAELPFTTLMSVLLIIWASRSGALPDLPGLPAFEISWMAGHPTAVGVTLILLAGLAGAVMILFAPRLSRFWEQVGAGVACLRRPRIYLTTVLPWHLLWWSSGLAAAFFFLEAFGVRSSLNNALLALVAAAIAGGIPLTPGGLGAKQALLLVLLAGEGTTTAVVAFSIGMEVTIIVGQLVAGVLAFGVLTKGFRIRSALAEARAERREERVEGQPAGAPPP